MSSNATFDYSYLPDKPIVWVTSQGSSMTPTTISWTECAKATSYDVYVDGSGVYYGVHGTSYTISLSAGRHIIRIAANNSNFPYYGAYDSVWWTFSDELYVDVEQHRHTYNQENKASTYLKTAATCTSAAVYYYSCTCGAKGTSTFTSGNPISHTYNQKNTASTYLKTAATCTSAAVYYYSCTTEFTFSGGIFYEQEEEKYSHPIE